jgi:hypothetical protein
MSILSKHMSNLILFSILIHLLACNENTDQKVKLVELKKEPSIAYSDSIPKEVNKMMHLFKDIVGFENNAIVFADKSKIIYDDSKNKSTDELLNNPDIEDMFHWTYNTEIEKPNNQEDPGRIRNEAFFKALYGENKEEVRKNLKSFVWCPKLVNQTIQFNKKNGAFEALKRVSDELDLHPEWKKYIQNIGGTFNWRNISGTNRLSAHSFGITIDINTSFSHYWQWDCGCKNENAKLGYKNSIPMELVEIFEKNGFIWGGRWYHYDTMHFEYRPEMFN